MEAQEWIDSRRRQKRVCEKCGDSFDFYEASDDFTANFPDYLDLDTQPSYLDYINEFDMVLCGKCAAPVFYDYLCDLYEN